MNHMHVMVVGTQSETLKFGDVLEGTGGQAITRCSDGRDAAEKLRTGEAYSWIFLEDGDATTHAVIGRALRSTGAQVPVTTLSHVPNGVELAARRPNVCAVERTADGLEILRCAMREGRSCTAETVAAPERETPWSFEFYAPCKTRH